MNTYEVDLVFTDRMTGRTVDLQEWVDDYLAQGYSEHQAIREVIKTIIDQDICIILADVSYALECAYMHALPQGAMPRSHILNGQTPVFSGKSGSPLVHRVTGGDENADMSMLSHQSCVRSRSRSRDPDAYAREELESLEV